MEGLLTIGRLAAEAEVPADTIRYYESVGLLPPPARSEAGYRLYRRADVRRLRLIRRAKLLGLPLAETKQLVEQTFGGSCAHLQQELLRRIPRQIAEVERRMDELLALKVELAALQTHLAMLDLSAADELVAECESCPCIDDTEGR